MINETSTAFIRDLIEKLSTHQYKESFDINMSLDGVVNSTFDAYEN